MLWARLRALVCWIPLAVGPVWVQAAGYPTCDGIYAYGWPFVAAMRGPAGIRDGRYVMSTSFHATSCMLDIFVVAICVWTSGLAARQIGSCVKGRGQFSIVSVLRFVLTLCIALTLYRAGRALEADVMFMLEYGLWISDVAKRGSPALSCALCLSVVVAIDAVLASVRQLCCREFGRASAANRRA